MHPDEKAFINTILAKPYDSAPRLIYADWLQEQGRRKHQKMRFEAKVIELATHIYRQMNLGAEQQGYKIFGIYNNKIFEIKKDTGRLVFWPRTMLRSTSYLGWSVHFYRKPKTKLLSNYMRG